MDQILIVDDEKYIADSIADIFIKGYPDTFCVHKAYIPKTALQIAQQHHIDVLVTDIEMPGMDGFELCKAIREIQPDIKCVLLTAYNNPDYMLKAFRNDIVDYVLKLENEEVIVNAVNKALQGGNRKIAPVKQQEVGVEYNPENENSALLNKIFQYVEENYEKDISLVRVAEYINFNSSYLSRLFKKTYGKTFSEYIWDFKLKKSQELLKHSNLKIHEISEKLGFESCAYFGKFFKKMTGMTPKEYRMKS